MFQPAPFYDDVAEGPEDVRAFWARTTDNVRVRLAIWPAGDKGTVLLLPGRTEYVEKYGQTAADLAKRGFATITIDWRGQGLADRPLKNPHRGHVTHFLDFQKDLDVLLDLAKDQNLPKPYYLLGHSMGGSIGLRALMEELHVNAAAFTAPMWGISLSTVLRPVAWILSTSATSIGLGHLHTPGSHRDPYAMTAPFDDNMLTTEAEMFAYMKRQLVEHPELALGSPSLRWLKEALIECRKKSEIAAPDVPALTFLGANERIVDKQAIFDRMAQWPNGALQVVSDAQHEVLMEKPAIRCEIFDQMTGHFSNHP